MLEDRRRDRHKFIKHVLCYKCDQVPEKHVKVPFLIEIHDISYGGLGIVTDYRMYKDMVLYFRLDIDDLRREFAVQVKWCKYEEGRFSSGVEFQDVVKDDIIFLHRIVHPLE